MITTTKLEKLKTEKNRLESLLLQRKGQPVIDEVLSALTPYFIQIDSMSVYMPLGRIRLARLFLETHLSNDTELFDSYARLANLIEDIEV